MTTTIGTGIWTKAFATTAKPRVMMSGAEFADAHRYVGTGPEQGRWRTSRTPYLREVLDAGTSWNVERVTMMCSAQIGKTEAILCLLQYFIQAEPSPILFVLPTVDVATEMSKERISPMIDATPELTEALADQGVHGGSRRKIAETLRMKDFPGGFLAMVGANAPSGLASRAVRVVLTDEVDRMTNTREGCPLELAEARTANFANRKIVTTSTPLDESDSKIYREFMAGDQSYFHVPCPHCGVFNKWELEQVKWDKDENNDVIVDSIRHECPECEGIIRGPGRPDDRLLAQGVFVPEKPERSKYHRSFHVWKIHSPWVPLSEIVLAYVKAVRSRDPSQLRTFQNLWLGKPYKPKRREDDAHVRVFRRREDYEAEVPAGVGILTCGVDVQGSYLATEVVGWGVDKESWGIEYRLFAGDPRQQDVWDQLTEYLRRPWRMANGAELNIAATFIDSGGLNTQDVYRYVSMCGIPNTHAIKGASRDGLPYVNRPNIVGQERVQLFTLGVDHGKDRLLNGWLSLREPGAGYCHFPTDPARGYDEDYFAGLFSEELEEKFERGVLKRRWIKKHKRNEPLDVRNYAMAAMEYLNPDLDEWVLYYAQQSAPRAANRATGQAVVTRQISKGVSL